MEQLHGDDSQDDEQQSHIHRRHHARKLPLRRTQASDQHRQRVGHAGHHDERPQATARFHQVGAPMRHRGHGGQHGADQRHGTLQAGRERRHGRPAAGQQRAVDAAQHGRRQPGRHVHRPQHEVVVEQRLHEDPEEHGVADGNRDQRRLPQARHERLERRRGADHLHAQAERHGHSRARSRQAGPVAPQHGAKQQRQRQDRSAQGRVDEDQGGKVGHQRLQGVGAAGR